MAKLIKPVGGIALLTCVGMSLAACVGGSGSSSGGSGGGSNTSNKVTLMYAFGGSQSTAFQQDVKAWAAKNNIDVTFQQSNNFQTQIVTAVNGGNAPDIAIFPQPGILNGYAEKGKLVALKDVGIDVDKLKANTVSGLLDAATVKNTVYGADVSYNVKGLWFYDKAQWAKGGYQVPTDYAGLEALFAKAKSNNVAPLCVGIYSTGGSAGWPATDWIEEYVLQTGGPDVYKKWVDHEIKFDSPEVKKAFAVYNNLVLGSGNAYGGRQAIASNNFQTALNPIFDNPQKCVTGMQGNFITQQGFFPDKVVNNLDSTVGWFATPPMQAGGKKMIEVGGDMAAMFNKGDAITKLYNYITNDPSFGAPIAKSGAAFLPNKAFDTSNYPNQTLSGIAKLGSSVDTAVFDGSDAMPGVVGSGSFWTNMVAYTAGQQDEQTTLQNIDKSWPASTN